MWWGHTVAECGYALPCPAPAQIPGWQRRSTSASRASDGALSRASLAPSRALSHSHDPFLRVKTPETCLIPSSKRTVSLDTSKGKEQWRARGGAVARVFPLSRAFSSRARACDRPTARDAGFGLRVGLVARLRRVARARGRRARA